MGSGAGTPPGGREKAMTLSSWFLGNPGVLYGNLLENLNYLYIGRVVL
jgi:hypothetical protein